MGTKWRSGPFGWQAEHTSSTGVRGKELASGYTPTCHKAWGKASIPWSHTVGRSAKSLRRSATEPSDPKMPPIPLTGVFTGIPCVPSRGGAAWAHPSGRHRTVGSGSRPSGGERLTRPARTRETSQPVFNLISWATLPIGSKRKVHNWRPHAGQALLAGRCIPRSDLDRASDITSARGNLRSCSLQAR